MKNLQLALKAEYFDEIKAGTKLFEFREYNEYWKKRLVDKHYKKLIITKGYPKKTDDSKIMTFDYIGYEIQTIQHKHFGSNPIKVFAIKILHNSLKV